MNISYAHNHNIFRKYSEILPFAICIFDFEENKLVYTNSVFENIIGYPPPEAEQILSLQMPELFHPEDLKLLAKSWREIKSGTEKQVEIAYRLRQKNGDYRWIRSRKIIFAENPDGTARQYLSIFKDISGLKSTEPERQNDELLQAKHFLEEALTAKERFFSVISHEIRTPLNAIIGMIHLLQQNPAAESQVEIVDTLKYSSDNLLALIDDVLDFSKMQAGKLEFEEIDFDVKLTLEYTRKLYDNKARDKGIGLHLHIDEAVPRYIKGDPLRLGQVLNNLVSNAIKFTEQGSVTLSLGVHNQTESELTLVFEVADTGMGISPDKLQSIFEPFRQSDKDINRRFGGTGLGLSIIKNLIDLQGGTIQVESTPGKGSSFKVELKYKQSRGLVSKPRPARSKPPLNLKILYVEDVIPNQFLMRGYCTHWNVDLDLAASGEEALTKIQAKTYDLIMMDIQLPGIDGYETAQSIREQPDKYFQHIPVFAVSASTPDSQNEKYKQAGMNGYILKPINPDKLYDTLAKVARRKAQAIARRNSRVFSQLDEIYREDAGEYRKLLKVMKRQFGKDKTALIKLVMEKDDAAVSQIRHRSVATLSILQQHDFIHFLESLTGLNLRNEEEIRYIITQVNYQFDEILTLIKHKIGTLRLQKSTA